MTDRPIIFSGPMVRAILDGRKTQTRRVLKPQPIEGGFWKDKPRPVQSGFSQEQWDRIYSGEFPDGFCCAQSFPYAPGDRLYVREAWAPETVDAEEGFYRPDYRATANGQPTDGRWRSPIFLPRRFSRLTLTVTDVRVERLQEISEADAVAEGLRGNAVGVWGAEGLIEDFADLWNSIHGPDAWDANPWVVALTFTVERRNIDARDAA